MENAALIAAGEHWYAARTSPRHEKSVTRHFVQRDLEYFLPLHRSLHRWKNGRKVQVELPLFPGYVFVRISRSERTRVLEVPGVVDFVGSQMACAHVSDHEIETLRGGLHLHKTEPHPSFVVGEPVRIKAGPLTGLKGILIRRASGWRVVLTVELIGQSVAVECDASDLETIDSSAAGVSNSFPTPTHS